MKSAENRNEDAVRKKQNQLTSAQISLTKYQKGLAEVTEELERNKLGNYLIKLQSLQIKLRRMRLKSKLLNRNMTII